MTFDIISMLFYITAIGFVVLFILLPRYGPHYISKLTCPNCRKSFNFHWIPGATLTSIINRSTRQLKCPYCHIKSTYDIASTRARKQKAVKKKKA